MEPTKFMFDLPKNKSAAIKVIGVGGGGSNAVNYMFTSGITGVDFVVCNTDVQALNNSPVPNKIQLGESVTEGLGAGANPEVGEEAALESIEEIKAFLGTQTKMVFITAGMGGGTGTGAAPVIAKVAKEMGLLTVGIVTSPFSFEGRMRLEQAEKGITKLRQNVDSLIVVNNDKLRETYGNLGRREGFAKADEVLATASKGIAEVISIHYDTNIDLRDAKTVLADSGTAIMGSATASGDNKALEAITTALNSPLLNDNEIIGAKNVLLLIVSGKEDITIDEIGVINDYIQKEAGNQANIIMGIGDDETLEDKISVTIIATGFPLEAQKYSGVGVEKIVHRLDSVNVEQENQIKVEEDFSPKKKMFSIAEDEVSYEKNTSNPIDMSKGFLPKDEQEDSTMELVLETKEPKKVNLLLEEESLVVAKAIKQEKPVSNKKRMFIKDDELDSFVPRNEMKEQQASLLPDFDRITQKIEERRKRLKKFNYKFQSEKDVEERERIPAYKRQGVDFLPMLDESPSDLKLVRDINGENQIRPNNFLHDNVD